MMPPETVKTVVEAALFCAGEPLSIERLIGIFGKDELPAEGARQEIRQALDAIAEQAEGHAFELNQVASGYRLQVRQQLSPWVGRLFQERPPRYSRALLETLALIAYRQPATRGDIEQVRGVTVSSAIVRTLLDRGWIRAVGQRETPGRPTMYGTTRQFLDYFNLKSLDELPPLEEIRALIEPQFEAQEPENADEPTAVPTPASEPDSDEAAKPLAEVVQLPVAER